MLKQLFELLDRADATGGAVAELMERHGAAEVSVRHVRGEKGETDFIRFCIPGERGRSAGGTAPTIGIVGRLGGLRVQRSKALSPMETALSALYLPG